MKQRAIICDLDGTLINCEHRLHFIQGEKKDWKSFLHPENIKKDTINEWCKTILQRFEFANNNGTKNKQIHILYVTGRNKSCSSETINTLLSSGFCWNHDKNLFMRKNEDFREDSVIKEEIYRTHIEPFYDVIFCIDDRQQVVDMWRRIGLICLQCDV